MKAAPVGGHTVAAGAQSGRDGAASLSQQRSDEQHHQFPPSRSSKQRAKDSQNFYNGIGKRHEQSSWGEIVLWLAPILPSEAFMPAPFPKLYKVKLRKPSQCAAQARQWSYPAQSCPRVCQD